MRRDGRNHDDYNASAASSNSTTAISPSRPSAPVSVRVTDRQQRGELPPRRHTMRSDQDFHDGRRVEPATRVLRCRADYESDRRGVNDAIANIEPSGPHRRMSRASSEAMAVGPTAMTMTSDWFTIRVSMGGPGLSSRASVRLGMRLQTARIGAASERSNPERIPPFPAGGGPSSSVLRTNVGGEAAAHERERYRVPVPASTRYNCVAGPGGRHGPAFDSYRCGG